MSGLTSSAGSEERATDQRRREDIASRPAHASGASQSNTAWISLHLFYQGDLGELARNLVAPLTSGLIADGRVRDFFFLRHWDGGDHLRLRVRPAETGLERELVERCTEYLRAHPSPERVTQEQYAAFAVALGRWEHLTSYTEVMYPNNSVRVIRYRPEHNRYGHGASVEAVERHFVESSRIALDLMRRGLPADRLDTAAFSLILLAWFVCQPDPAALHASIASYARAAGEPPPIKLWAEFEERYLAQRDRLLALGTRLRALAACPPELLGSGSLAEWTASVARLRDTLSTLDFAGPGRGWEGPGGITGAGILTVVDICAHLICNRLGVTLAEEGYARYLAGQITGALSTVGAPR
jgi:thiopeptide-type bacteriocin biosynthesis protein